MKTLFDEIAVARTTDPETSHRAAASVKRICESQQAILDALRTHGPMHDELIFACVSDLMSPSGARTRRSELVRDGLVRDSMKRAKTASNRETIIWEAV